MPSKINRIPIVKEDLSEAISSHLRFIKVTITGDTDIEEEFEWNDIVTGEYHNDIRKINKHPFIEVTGVICTICGCGPWSSKALLLEHFNILSTDSKYHLELYHRCMNIA